MSRFPHLTLLALIFFGCSNDSDPDSGVPRPTLVKVDPAHFVACAGGTADREQKRYVSTVCDVTAPKAGETANAFVLPSSPPAACFQPVTFSYVAPGHRYIGRVDEYSRNDVEVVVPGDRLLKRTGSDPIEVIEPQQIYACNESVLALTTLTREVRGCKAPEEAGTSLPGTHVFVKVKDTVQRARPECADPAVTLKALREGTETPLDPSQETHDISLDPNSTCVNLSLVAYRSGQPTPLWTAHCYAMAVENRTQNAVCDPPKCVGTQ